MQPPKRIFAPVIQGLPTKGGKQARLQGKMSKLTAGGTKTPTGKDLTKYNKAATKNRKIDDARSNKLGYGTVTQSVEANLKPNVYFPAGYHSAVNSAQMGSVAGSVKGAMSRMRLIKRRSMR
jgi:hypothetical protein